MTEKVYQWIEREALIEAGDMVLAGVSGGADSVCLLLFLLEYRCRLGFSLEVVHVEHGIRGDESGADARFVEGLCGGQGIRCHTYHVDVPGYAAQQGMGIEEAARTLRYDCYEKAAMETGAPRVKVALAHHANDNAETLLFQMARGSGIRGLSGIRPKRPLAGNTMIIRPLLTVTRGEIERYLSLRGQDFCVDGTNLDTDYSRNRIRHEVIPELVKVNRQAVSHIAQSAGVLLELYEYVAEEVQRILPQVCSFTCEGCVLRMELFEAYPPVLQKEVVHRALGETAGSRRDIGSTHVEEVQRLATLQVGRSVSLPYRLCAERTYEGICVRRTLEPETGAGITDACAQEEYEITPGQLLAAEQDAGVYIPLPDATLHLHVFNFDGEMRKIRKKTYTKWLNYDKIKRSLRFRKRAGGDYLTIDEKGHTKKLKEYLIGERIPRERRDKIWLLTEESHVLWVVGGRISADCRIEPDTKKILEVQIIGGSYCED